MGKNAPHRPRAATRQNAERLRFVEDTPLFDAPLATSVTATRGPAATFTRSGIRKYCSTASLVSGVGDGLPATGATEWGAAGTNKGTALSGARKNFLKYSEDISNAAWVSVGTPSAKLADIVAGPDGATSGNVLVNDAADEGITQDTGVAAISTFVVFSAWIATNTGTEAGKITVMGTGGTPEREDAAFTATTTWQRLHVYKAFSGSATGNVQAQITTDTDGVLYLWGMQLEFATVASYGQYSHDPSAYIYTTDGVTPVPTTASDSLKYAVAAWPPGMTAGTIMLWHNSAFDSVARAGFTSVYLCDTDSAANRAAFYITPGAVNDAVSMYYNGSTSSATISGHAWSRAVWSQLALTWVLSGSTVTWVAYKNGAQIGTNTIGSVTAPTMGSLVIGARGDLNVFSYGDGVYRNFRIYPKVLSLGAIKAKYDSEKAGFGL